jgi:hypothetical protein
MARKSSAAPGGSFSHFMGVQIRCHREAPPLSFDLKSLPLARLLDLAIPDFHRVCFSEQFCCSTVVSLAA